MHQDLERHQRTVTVVKGKLPVWRESGGRPNKFSMCTFSFVFWFQMVSVGSFWSDVDTLRNCYFLGWVGVWDCAHCRLKEGVKVQAWAGHAFSSRAFHSVLHILQAQNVCAEWINQWISEHFGGISSKEQGEMCGDRMWPMDHESLVCVWSLAHPDVCEDSSP